VGIDIPYISHSGGFLDAFIDDWHDFWGLPDGGRPGRARSLLEYRYRRANRDQVLLTASTGGIGDAMLTFAVPLAPENRMAALAVRAGLKLPTGDAGRLTGSGGTDFFLWLAGESLQAPAGISVFGRAGAAFLGSGDLLDDRRRDLAAFASIGAGWQALDRLELKVETAFSQPCYHSALTELGAVSGQLVLGGSVSLSAGIQLDLGLSEDILVDTAPDVTFSIAISRRISAEKF